MGELLQITFIDDRFSVDKSGFYQLLVSEGSLNYQMAIIGEDNELLLLLNWKKDAVETRVQHLLDLTYASKKITLNNKSTLLIPSTLYNSSQDYHYLNMLALSESSHVLLSDSLPSFAIHNIYPYTKSDISIVDQNFPGFSFKSRSTSILSALEKLNPAKTYLSVHINDDGFSDFTYIEDGEIRYHQAQPNEHAEEFNYFFLAIAEELGFNFNQTPIFVSGATKGIHPYVDRLEKYSKKVHALPLSELVTCTRADILQNIHQQLPLFGLLCVS